MLKCVSQDKKIFSNKRFGGFQNQQLMLFFILIFFTLYKIQFWLLSWEKVISHKKWETQIEIIVITAKNLEEKLILLAVLNIESTKERAVPG